MTKAINILKNFWKISVLGLLVFMIIAVIEEVIIGGASKIFNYIMPELVVVGLVGPIIEEAFKMGLLKRFKVQIAMSVILWFVLAEGVSYTIGFWAVQGIIFWRIAAVLMHMVTAYVQLQFQKKDNALVGYLVGVVIHSLYNITTVTMWHSIYG